MARFYPNDPGRRSDPVPARAPPRSRTANIIFPAPASLRSIYNHASPRQPYEQLHFTLHSCVCSQPSTSRALPPHSACPRHRHRRRRRRYHRPPRCVSRAILLLSFSLDDSREKRISPPPPPAVDGKRRRASGTRRRYRV